MGDITSNLELWLKLDDGSGSTATDSSGNARHQTISGNPTWGTGQVGGCLVLDGTGDYINTGVTGYGTCTLFATGGGSHIWTVALWAKYSSNSAGAMAARAGATAGNRTFQLAPLSGTADPRINVRGTSNDFLSGSDNAWHHWAVTYDGTTCTAYKDGSSLGALTVGGAAEEGSQNICFGARENGGAVNFTGSLDDIRLYSRALASGDISDLYAYTGSTGTASAFSGRAFGLGTIRGGSAIRC